MLKQLKEQQNTADEVFRDSLLRMLALMRSTQLMIMYFQETTLVKSGNEYKQLKRFSKEVYTKLEWFHSVILKMAGENAPMLEQELALENEKISSVLDAVGFITLSKQDVSNAVDLMVSNSRRKEIFKKSWIHSRITFSPKMQVDLDEFEKWYEEMFPSSNTENQTT